jgi:hypothetical protein
MIMTVEKIKFIKKFRKSFFDKKGPFRHSKIIVTIPENFTSLTIEQEEKIIKFFETL